MLLLDLHAHTSGISPCCRIAAPAVVAAAKEIGLDGIVLTNHYDKSYVKNGDADAFARAYVEEFRYTKRCGEAVGCTVLYGIEITMARYGGLHMLLYGVDEAFTLAHPTLYDLTKEELYSLAHENGGIVVQPHPFRGRSEPSDPAFLDGVEINCHPLYGTSRYDDVTAIATENRLLLTCGGDYHADTYRPFCGVFCSEGLQTSRDLVEFLRSADTVEAAMQEPSDGLRYRVSYTRSLGRCLKTPF